MKSIYDRADDEVENIENDESLTEQEKRQAIKEIRAELRDYERINGGSDYNY